MICRFVNTLPVFIFSFFFNKHLNIIMLNVVSYLHRLVRMWNIIIWNLTKQFYDSDKNMFVLRVFKICSVYKQSDSNYLPRTNRILHPSIFSLYSFWDFSIDLCFNCQQTRAWRKRNIGMKTAQNLILRTPIQRHQKKWHTLKLLLDTYLSMHCVCVWTVEVLIKVHPMQECRKNFINDVLL